MDRLFIGIFPEGISYCDRNNDCAKVAFLSFATLKLHWGKAAKNCPGRMIRRIKRDARKLKNRQGECFRTSSSGQTITLGYALKEKGSV